MSQQVTGQARTELQQAVEDQRIAQLHLTNILRMMLRTNDEESQETLIVAAIRFAESDYDHWERIDAIANLQAEKGGA